MFGLTQLEERLAWLALVIIVIFGFAWHERDMGAAKCRMDDAQVAAVQKAAQAVQRAADAKRVKDAEDAYQNEVSANAQLRISLPADHLVCVAPGPQRMSAAASVQKARPAVAGSLPSERSPNPVTFDPGAQLDTLFDEADDVLSRCRELDAAVPH